MENSIFISFAASLERLREVLGEPKTTITRDAAIQRFEFTVELAWKAIQKLLRTESILCRSPKECLREAFKLGLVADDGQWMQVLDDRNLTAHTYDEVTADEIYHRMPNYLELFQNLKEKMEKRQEA